ncbi:MAG: phenylalanine--tRNA ligase subunit beta, partial [Deltaproteobacteria bacterium]|nr:phenylalanine--tRNA ligase subunit beta [Deltaproteobacteria bacterium]
MICSEVELGIGSDQSGIMVLPPEQQTGIALADALGLDDTLLDLSITPNRADCFSVIGLAREIAALFDVPFSLPSISVPESNLPVDDRISVRIDAPELCPRYTARYIDNVNIGSAPLWMRQRLENCGIRSINTIVDITNYVLLEWGQPLHAFDYSRLHDGRIVVKRAAKGDVFTTLDEQERSL